jgi:hypothetical protein
MINFQVSALEAVIWTDLFSMPDEAIKAAGIIKMKADKKPGFPCRISLEDAEPGEEVILFNHEHQAAASPYKSSGAIFVRKNAITARPAPNQVPLMLRHRLLSVRAYTKKGMMQKALVTEGILLEEAIQELFASTAVDYLHIHNAKQGCWLCSVIRIS